MRKYRNQPIIVDGIKFDSKAESKRFRELKLLERAGEVSHLETQPKYVITIGGKRICSYTADFRYRNIKTGELIVEDFKSPATAKDKTYRLKKKLVEALYAPLEIREVMK